MSIVNIPTNFSSYAQAMKFLNEDLPAMPVVDHAGELGLERVFELLKDLGGPQNKLKVTHIAGTSGKGSTAYMIAELLAENGVKTGLSVSPYVYDMKERWLVDGSFIDDQVILDAVNIIMPSLIKASMLDRLTSRFETIIIVMFVIMNKLDVEHLVLETGMGGLLDPTNTILRQDKVSVLTTIGLDHTHILGSDINEIARHKAGIIQPNSKVFTYEQAEGINQAFREVAEGKQADLESVEIVDVKFDKLMPAYFDRNASLATAVANYVLNRDCAKWVEQSFALDVLAKLQIPGRLEQLSIRDKDVIFDGAHNLQKIEALTSVIKTGWLRSDVLVLAVIARDQQAKEILKQLDSVASRIILIDYPQEIKGFKNSVSTQKMQLIAEELGVKVETPSNYEQAINIAMKDERKNLLVTGSFYHLGSIKKILQDS